MAEYVKNVYRVEELQPGMEVGDDVLTEGGQVMLAVGTVLTMHSIEGLKCWDIPSIVIRKAIITEPEVFDVPKVKNIRISVDVPEINKRPEIIDIPISIAQQEFNNKYDTTTNTIKKAFGSMRYFKEVPVKEMKAVADEAVFPMLESIGVINNLHMVHRQNDYTFHHSINVAVICGVLGKWLGYNGTKLSDLILAGLLHDVGKSQIPLEILDKPEMLTIEEMSIMQAHTTIGYKMLKDNKELSPHVIYAVLQHHERMDGSGYPFKVTANKLHQYARIVAIADTYDAMTSDRVYHKKVTPFAVVETMVGEMYNKLDPDICTVFLNNVRNYFTGNIVKLSDGRRAEVVYVGTVIASRPTVRTDDGEFIDLEKNKHIGIIELTEA